MHLRPLTITFGSTVTALLAALTIAAQPAGAQTSMISTVAGTDPPGYSGDGGPATSARLHFPSDVAVTADGGYLIADLVNARVRRVAPGGTISTVAGSGLAGFGGDGGPATAASLFTPVAVAVTADGGFLIAEYQGHRVRRVSPAGTITTVAGTGVEGFAGDGGPATTAQLDHPTDVAVTADGGFLIADSDNNRVRRVSPGGTISTAAGGSLPGFGGDGGPATAAKLFSPQGVAATGDGGFLITDGLNDRVRRVSSTGIISTVAGIGVEASGGDGGPATAAAIHYPRAVATTGDGGFVVSDSNYRVRRVSPAGTISTIAGNGVEGFAGDCGSATSARITTPYGIAVAGDGAVLIADRNNQRVRRVGAWGPCGAGGRQPAPQPAPPPPPRSGAKVILFGGVLSRTRFAPVGRGGQVDARRGALLTFSASETGRLELRIERAIRGRRSGGRCSPRVRRGAPCILFRRVGTLTATLRIGGNRLQFTGRVADRPLARGRYRFRASLRTTDGRRSNTLTRRFTITRL
jgi:NHL repeat